MINNHGLLKDLQKLLKKLEDDMRRRCNENRDIDSKIRIEYEKAKSARRTSHAYEIWRDDLITQAGAAWILGCVFVRFLEDNLLIDPPRIAGRKERLKIARDNHTLYFREYPVHSDREYLEHAFRDVGTLPGISGIFDEKHNPLWMLGPSGDGATELLNFWQSIDSATGELKHDFTDEEWNTRFLGDLYQDLSESAQKKYALKQTPIFVEEFILDRTLNPAIDEFGYKQVKMIDPACGSGHFLLGAFDRLFNLWARNEPGLNSRATAQNVLDSVYGVDINPFAAAIAKFRLLLAALKASDIHKLSDAPNFKINVATGDSLLHGKRSKDIRGPSRDLFDDPLQHYYETEDAEELKRILERQYHAVVGNPPYITPKDPALNQAYRDRFGSCHMKYSLAVPFMERFFDLAVDDERAGFVGMITANSFMKREFGKKLIETYIPQWDLTHVIDTSGAYIPGHGTPTVIIFSRNRKPVKSTIRAVMGIKGEPGTPEDPSYGFVWRAIVTQIDEPGSQSDFVSVADTNRNNFHNHPWSIGGGGAAELKSFLDNQADTLLGEISESIGITSFTLEDDVFILPPQIMIRLKIPSSFIRRMVEGEFIRDWKIEKCNDVLFPYDSEFNIVCEEDSTLFRLLWLARTVLSNNKMFGSKTKLECGLKWYEFGRLTSKKLRIPFSITFAEVATHNHFVLDRGGKVFNRSAPVIKLPAGSTEEDHIRLLGLLNSSTACFWLKQVCFNKGSTVDQKGARQRTMPFEDFYVLNGTKIEQFPLTKLFPLEVSIKLSEKAQELSALLPQTTLKIDHAVTRKNQALLALQHKIVLQEELDWECYRLYGLLEENLNYPIDQVPPIKLGERAFEIVMARKMAEGELEISWFERHGSTPITEIPSHWPDDYRKLVQRRIETIENNHYVNLIERPEYKRRWNMEPWESQQERALREWLLNRLEESHYWNEIALTSTSKLADKIRQDPEFMQVAEFYRGRPDFDVAKLVEELVESEAVPFLPILRYKESGLRYRKIWEETWEKQRQEDRIDARTKLTESDPDFLTEEQAKRLKEETIGTITVPPKYKSADFLNSTYWRLRGKLDVPKERFVSYPHCEREADRSLAIAWAGWDHLQQASALSGYIETVAKPEGWSNERIVPLLAGLIELLPWLEQWHNEIDPKYGMRMGEFFRGYIEEEAKALGKTIDEIRSWKPSK